MAFKFIALAALVACVSGSGLTPAALPIAAPLAYAAPLPIAKTVLTKVTDTEYDPHPQYSYSYDVADSLTGDFKAQTETRDGDVVRGSYSLLESDGTRRVVDYAADALNGFNAVVRKEPATLAVKTAIPAAIPAAPVAIKTALPAPVAVAAPAPLPYAAAPAPLAYAAPAPLAYAAPAPAFTTYAAGPAIAKFAAPAFPGYAAPAFARFAAPAPALAYPGPAYATTYNSPLVTKTFY